MIINIKATRLALTDAIQEYVEEKIGALEKFSENLDVARVELEKLLEKKTDSAFRAEVTIDAPHGFFRADCTAPDLYAAIDLVVPKITVQIEKYKHKKTRIMKKSRRQAKEIA